MEAEDGLTWTFENIEVKEFTLQTDPCKTYYRVWGNGPIRALFLHGGPGKKTHFHFYDS
jgi:hypothetical protein